MSGAETEDAEPEAVEGYDPATVATSRTPGWPR